MWQVRQVTIANEDMYEVFEGDKAIKTTIRSEADRIANYLNEKEEQRWNKTTPEE